MMRRLLIILIKAYGLLLSPMLGNRCRFYPSCSEYAATAIGRFGVLHGTALAAWRLLRCNPWHPGGVDFVPQDHLRHRHG